MKLFNRDIQYIKNEALSILLEARPRIWMRKAEMVDSGGNVYSTSSDPNIGSNHTYMPSKEARKIDKKIALLRASIEDRNAVADNASQAIRDYDLGTGNDRYCFIVKVVFSKERGLDNPKFIVKEHHLSPIDVFDKFEMMANTKEYNGFIQFKAPEFMDGTIKSFAGIRPQLGAIVCAYLLKGSPELKAQKKKATRDMSVPDSFIKEMFDNIRNDLGAQGVSFINNYWRESLEKPVGVHTNWDSISNNKTFGRISPYKDRKTTYMRLSEAQLVEYICKHIINE
jgi:hypothetical protein